MASRRGHLVEIEPSFGDVLHEYHAGQADPIYAISSRWHAGHFERGSNIGLDWRSDHGEGYFMRLSDEELAALERLARDVHNGRYRPSRDEDDPNEDAAAGQLELLRYVLYLPSGAVEQGSKSRGSRARRFKVSASSPWGTYTAGVFEAESPADAVEMARESYRRSTLGRELKDVGAFRFYVTASAPIGKPFASEQESSEQEGSKSRHPRPPAKRR
jgi:hypothetical protein